MEYTCPKDYKIFLNFDQMKPETQQKIAEEAKRQCEKKNKRCPSQCQISILANGFKNQLDRKHIPSQ